MHTPPSFRKGRNSNTRSSSTSSRGRSRKVNRSHKYKLRENAGALHCQNHIISAFLNVDGLSDSTLEDVHYFASQQSPDIFVLLETKRRFEEFGSDISVPGYDLTEIRRSDAAGDKSGGGLAYYTKNTGGILFKRHSPNIEHKDLEYVNNERFWVTVESQKCKTAFCSAYLGCQYGDDRNKDWNDGIYWVLRQEAVALRSSGYRLQFLGDYNGHVGNILGQGVLGNSGDINNNGERFLNFLMSCDLRHINGELRTAGDPDSKICSGLWTRQRGNSRSVIDFVSVSAEHVDTVVSMHVDDSGTYGGGSDHNWVWVKMTDCFKRLVPIVKKAKEKDVWAIKDDQDWSSFKEAVAKHLPQDSLSSLGVDELTSLLTSAFRAGGLSAIGYKKKVRRTSMKSRSLPKELVSEIELKRKMEQTWKTLSSSAVFVPEAVAAAEEAFNGQKARVTELFKVLRQSDRLKVRAACSGKTAFAMKNFWAAVTGKVKQSSDISAVLSSSGVLKCSSDEISEEVEKHLCKVFQGSMECLVPTQPFADLHSDHSYSSSHGPAFRHSDHTYAKSPSPRLPRVGVSDDVAKNPSNWLARDFSAKELKNIASRLNNGKARGWDNIPSEFIKNAPDLAFDILTLLFNKIKNSGIYPKGWNCGRITLVHKKGLRASLGNYRPITVLISMSGFYSKVLNERLIEVVETHNLLGEIQNGFRKERCGADNIFVLNTILWKARSLGEKVHMGFVDIQKAYDSVNREILWEKLESLGFSGPFLQTLKSMYSGDSVKCTVNGITTRSVFLKRGLRQGCSLSPMLFALYILGVGEGISSSQDGFQVGNTSISGLLFADDIVLVSRTAAGLMNLFRIVKTHCDELLLDINTGDGKSEVISPGEDLWELFDQDGSVELSLRQVLEYSYLGLETTSSILRTCMAKQAKCIKIANKYKFACLHLGKRGPDVVDMTLATWTGIAIPRILFGCESIIFKEYNIAAIEKTQIAKNLLGVPSNTVNICAQTELGLFPFRLCLYKAQLKFYFRVLGLPNSRWVKQALLEHLSLSWPSPYLSYIVSVREAVCLPFVPATPRYLSVHLAQWSLSEINHALSQLSLPYVKCLTVFKKQPYVFEHEHLNTVAQFRLSNAGLGNRFPRFATTTYARRTSCPLCTSLLLSEGHVVFFCPAVENFRRELDLCLFRTICQTKGFSEDQTFSLFVNGQDWNEKPVSSTDFASRGLALDTMRGHWLSRW